MRTQGTDRRAQGTSRQRVWPAAAFAALLLVIWEVVVRAFGIKERVLPAPTTILESGIRDWPRLWAATVVTGGEVVAGMVLAVALAVLCAFVMWLVPAFERMAMPLLVVSQTIPIIAITPLLIIWFGFSPATKVLLVALFGFFPMVIALQSGLRSPDQAQIDVARTLGASRWWLLKNVRAKAARESFLSGLRISVTYAPATAAAAEFVGARKGLGIYLLSAQSSFRTELVFVGGLALSIMTLLLYVLVDPLERVLVPWKREAR